MNKRQYMLKTFERQRLLNKIHATPGPNSFVIVLDHLKVDFNIGKIIRSAEAFGAAGVHIIGTSFFDPMPAKGCMKRVPFKMTKTFMESYMELKNQGYTFYAFDSEASETIYESQFPEKAAFILGHEGFGFTFNLKDFPEIKTVRIPQTGKVESLNVSVAASVVMYEYNRQKAISVIK